MTKAHLSYTNEVLRGKERVSASRVQGMKHLAPMTNAIR